MKVAVSSSSFARPLAAGELTQLEWLERCASDLGVDGVVFAREHFPRTDAEYVAQVKKVTVDLGLVPVALDAGGLLDPDGPNVGDVLALAAGLGVLFVLTRLPAPGDVPPATFVAAVIAAKAAVREAKRVNVTILASAAPGTIGSDIAGVKHFLKDVDSAWLRLAVAGDLESGSLGARDRALVVFVGEADAAFEEGARPWLVLEGPADTQRVRTLRAAAAKKTLDGTNAF
jgi:sugar phosphate isomerase/epimerase